MQPATQTASSLWLDCGDNVFALVIGPGALDEYTVVGTSRGWRLDLPKDREPWPGIFRCAADAKRAAVQHLSAVLWGELTP